MSKATGWACLVDEVIMINTVSNSRRAAIVNGLVILFNVQVSNDWTDEAIERSFLYCTSLTTHTVIAAEVEVGRMP